MLQNFISMLTILANAANILSATMSLLFGLVYLFRSKFMNYHSATVEKKWEDVAPQLQTLILALMRSLGGGLVSVSITIFYLQYQFHKQHQSWIPLAIVICGITLTLGILYAQLSVIKKTKGRPPIFSSLLALVLLTIGYFLNIATLTNS